MAELAALGLFLWQNRNPRVIARAAAPNGVEVCVVQVCNWWPGEPYTTSVYYRKPGSPWGWFYYDHQDRYWHIGRAEVDHQRHLIEIERSSDVVATFDYVTETFTLERPDWPRRVITGAQEWKLATWTFADIGRGVFEDHN